MAALLRFHRDITWTGSISAGSMGPGTPAMTAQGSGTHTTIQYGRRVVGDYRQEQYLLDGTHVLTWQLHWVAGWDPALGEYRATVADCYGHAEVLRGRIDRDRLVFESTGDPPPPEPGRDETLIVTAAARAAGHLQVPEQRPRRPALAVVHPRRSPVTRWRAGPLLPRPAPGRRWTERGEDIGALASFLRPSVNRLPPTGEGRSRDRAWLVPRTVDVDHDDRADAQRRRLDRPAGGATMPRPQRRPRVCWRGVTQGCATCADMPPSRSTD